MATAQDHDRLQWTDASLAEDLANALDDSPDRVETHSLPAGIASQGEHSGESRSPSAMSGQVGNGQVVEDGDDKSNRTSFSHFDPLPGFAHIDGDVGGTGYNETTVDIVTVPCPGADPVETWTRDPLPDGYFGVPSDQELSLHPAMKELAGDAILSPAINRHLPRAAHLWVRQGLRKVANRARVMLYRHRELVDGLALDDLAQDLLNNVLQIRDGENKSRPVFFIAHSVGGLVVKLALLKARHDDRYRGILYNCHGLTFFATPHRGSSYMSMPNLRESIQTLLHLQRPLPRSIARDLRLGNKDLLKIHDEFTNIASEMRIWTFYETIDSQLSGSGMGLTDEVQFSAPLASIKSSLVGVRQENVFSSLESDHAHCASFGTGNTRTMGTYLEDLALAVAKAEQLSAKYVHTPLNLKEHVKVELIGFYEDPDAEMESAIRLYFTKYHLGEFLEKGPERCLEERLRSTVRRPGPRPFPVGGDSTVSDHRSRPVGNSGLNILTNVQSMFRAARSGTPPKDAEAHPSPDIVVNPPSARPSVGGGSNSMPATLPRRPHSLTVPSLGSPGFHRPSSRASSEGSASTMSDPTGDEISPKDGKGADMSGHISEKHSAQFDTKDFDPTTKSRVDRLSRASALQDLTAGFSRPNPDRRKFMWIHLPFTNPPWVKNIFDKLSETHGQNFGKLFNNENWVSRHVQGRHSQSQPSFVKPACNYIPADSAASPRPSPANSRPTSPGISPSYMYLYLPYLHFDTYLNIIKRRNIMKRRTSHGRARPVPADIAQLESLEMRVLWEFMGYDPPLNCRRTLDQFGYPSLKDT